jgi:hypothetical protein
MRLSFCQFSVGPFRRPVEIDPTEVTGLWHGTRPVPRGKFVKAVNVLVIGMRDGTEYVVFDAHRQVARRIAEGRVAETRRAAPVAGGGPSQA